MSNFLASLVRVNRRYLGQMPGRWSQKSDQKQAIFSSFCKGVLIVFY